MHMFQTPRSTSKSHGLQLAPEDDYVLARCRLPESTGPTDAFAVHFRPSRGQGWSRGHNIIVLGLDSMSTTTLKTRMPKVHAIFEDPTTACSAIHNVRVPRSFTGTIFSSYSTHKTLPSASPQDSILDPQSLTVHAQHRGYRVAYVEDRCSAAAPESSPATSNPLSLTPSAEHVPVRHNLSGLFCALPQAVLPKGVEAPSRNEAQDHPTQRMATMLRLRYKLPLEYASAVLRGTSSQNAKAPAPHPAFVMIRLTSVDDKRFLPFRHSHLGGLDSAVAAFVCSALANSSTASTAVILHGGDRVGGEGPHFVDWAARVRRQQPVLGAIVPEGGNRSAAKLNADRPITVHDLHHTIASLMGTHDQASRGGSEAAFDIVHEIVPPTRPCFAEAPLP